MKILFQGDSITDCNRDYSDSHELGQGYAKMSAELIRARHSDMDFEFINLGINGHRVETLFDRWSRDCINLQPDIVSILIGVNDTWHCAESRDWMPNDKFEFYYRALLERIKKETSAKIIMIEQFLLYREDYQYFHEDLDPKIQITRKLAREYADVFIPMDGIFAAESIKHAPSELAADGVHPTPLGASIMAEYYADAVDALL